MKIHDVIWFTQIPTEPMVTCFGIVFGEDAVTGERKAYIGAVTGRDEAGDALDIVSCGARINYTDLSTIIDYLTRKEASCNTILESK